MGYNKTLDIYLKQKRVTLLYSIVDTDTKVNWQMYGYNARSNITDRTKASVIRYLDPTSANPFHAIWAQLSRLEHRFPWPLVESKYLLFFLSSVPKIW